MIWLTKSQLIHIHSDMGKETGGSDGLRDEGLLESALSAPFQAFDSVDFFPTIKNKAARLGYGLTQFHPFVDGNKRIGAHAMLLVLALNGITLSYTQEELSDLFLGIASGKVSYDRLDQWVTAHPSK